MPNIAPRFRLHKMMNYRSLTGTLCKIVNIQLKGIGQIMLQESPWTGLLFLAGLAVGNWQWAAAAFLATAIGNLTAELLNFNKKNLRAGLYGFSPALVGVALLVFFKSTLLLWILVPVGAAAAAVLQEFFLRRNFPAYTFPFIAVTWLLVFIVRNYTSVPPSELVQSELTSVYDTYTYGFKGIGQVIFQEKLWVGVIFLSGYFFIRLSRRCLLLPCRSWQASSPILQVNLGTIFTRESSASTLPCPPSSLRADV